MRRPSSHRISYKLLEKKSKKQPPNDAPKELDGYRLERSAPGDQETPTVARTHSVIEINQPAQNQGKKKQKTILEDEKQAYQTTRIVIVTLFARVNLYTILH